jgi:hypothetical protein
MLPVLVVICSGRGLVKLVIGIATMGDEFWCTSKSVLLGVEDVKWSGTAFAVEVVWDGGRVLLSIAEVGVESICPGE